MSANSGPNRRSFLARSAAVAAVPAVAALAGGALAHLRENIAGAALTVPADAVGELDAI
jgi:hypothetical protein